MALSPEDNDALEHHKKMLKIRTRRLYILEEQEAEFGSLSVPAHIRSEIDKITEQLHQHKTEIDRLETLNVEGETPLNEVEYRVILAEAWDTPIGRPTVVGQARIEFARLRLHIDEGRSEELEWDVRKRLIRERFSYNREIELLTSEAFVSFAMRITNPDKYIRDIRLERAALDLFTPFIYLHPGQTFIHIMRWAHLGRDALYHPFKAPYRDRWLRVIATYIHGGDGIGAWKSIHAEYFPGSPFDPRDWPKNNDAYVWHGPNDGELFITNLISPQPLLTMNERGTHKRCKARQILYPARRYP